MNYNKGQNVQENMNHG